MAYRTVPTPYGYAVVQVNPFAAAIQVNPFAAAIQVTPNPFGARVGLCNVCRCRIPMEGRARCYDCYKASLSCTPSVPCAPVVQECASLTCHNQANPGYRFCQKCYNEAKDCKRCGKITGNKRSGLTDYCAGCRRTLGI